MIYKRAKPQEINTANINFKSGGTDFENAFQMAYNLAR